MMTEYGLTYQFTSSSRCDKCDVLIAMTSWRGHQICYNKSMKPRKGFLCVDCLTNNKNWDSRLHYTPEQLDNFIQGKPVGPKGDKPKSVYRHCNENNHESCRNTHGGCACLCHTIPKKPKPMITKLSSRCSFNHHIGCKSQRFHCTCDCHKEVK